MFVLRIQCKTFFHVSSVEQLTPANLLCSIRQFHNDDDNFVRLKVHQGSGARGRLRNVKVCQGTVCCNKKRRNEKQGEKKSKSRANALVDKRRGYWSIKNKTWNNSCLVNFEMTRLLFYIFLLGKQTSWKSGVYVWMHFLSEYDYLFSATELYDWSLKVLRKCFWTTWIAKLNRYSIPFQELFCKYSIPVITIKFYKQECPVFTISTQLLTERNWNM